MFQKTGMWGTIRVYQTIHTEVSVMYFLVPVTAVEEFVFAFEGLTHIDGVVTPFPYETTDITGILVETFKISLQISRSVTHSVAVFYFDKWFFTFFRAELIDKFHRCIHPGEDIQIMYIVDIISIGLLPDTVLIVQNTIRVVRFDPCGGFFHIRTVCTFISHGPGEDAGAVFVSVNQVLDTIYDSVFIRRIAHQIAIAFFVLYFSHIDMFTLTSVECGTSVGFQICFIHNIKTVFVIHLCGPWSIWIMAGTDRIDVMFLHQLQISQKLFPCDCSSGKRIAVVAVGTFDLEVHTVDIDDISFDIDPAKADFLSDHFIRCGKNQRIQCRMFCIPQIRIIYGKPHFFVRRSGSSQEISVWCIQLYSDGRRATKFQIDQNLSFGKILAYRCMDKIITDMIYRTNQQVNVAEDTGKTKFILIFQIGSVTPF